MTIFCPNCGNKNQDDAICCSNCGEALPHNDGRDDSKIQVTMPNLPDYENPDPVKEAEFAAALEAAGINFKQFMAIALNLAILASWATYLPSAHGESTLGAYIIIDGVGALFAMLLNSKLSFAITSFISIIPFFIFCFDLNDTWLGVAVCEGIILVICNVFIAINAKK